MFSYVSPEQRIPQDHPVGRFAPSSMRYRPTCRESSIGCMPRRDDPRFARSFLQRVVERAKGLMSDEHFTVDGTLIEAWASQKSLQRKDGKPDGDGKNFRERRHTNDIHASTTDPDATLYRKSNGAEPRLAYLGRLLIENRHGLIVDAMATQADRRVERDAGLLMLHAQCNACRGDDGPSAPMRPATCANLSTWRASRAAPHSRRISTAQAGALSAAARLSMRAMR